MTRRDVPLLSSLSPVLVLALGLWSWVLILVKDGLVEIVKECSRRKDGRKGTSAQAEEWAPFRTAGEWS